MAGWETNWDSSEGKGKLPKVAFNDLREAYLERCDGIDRTPDANITVISTNELIPNNWMSSFQSEISLLIVKYVNQTADGGMYDGLSGLTMWLESTIIAAIGDAARLPAPTDPLVSATWMYQQYKIINMLRWASGRSFPSANFRPVAQQEKVYVGLYSDSWATIEAGYNAASWTGFVGWSFWAVVSAAQTPFSNLKSLVRERSKIQFTSNNTLGKSIDWYQETGRLAVIGTIHYDNNSEVNAVDTIYLIESTTEDTSSVITNSNYFTGDSAPPNHNLMGSSQEHQGWATLGTSGGAPLRQPSLVVKYDGANGFTYKDW